MVKLVDTTDLKSVARVKPAYRFDSGPGHHHGLSMGALLFWAKILFAYLLLTPDFIETVTELFSGRPGSHAHNGSSAELADAIIVMLYGKP